MRLNELFDRKFPYTWIQKSDDMWLAEFDAGDRKYHITIRTENEFVNDENEPVIFWDLGFVPADNSLAGEHLMPSGGQEFKVFSTVLSAFREFLQNVQPKMFSFSAHVTVPHRARLYRKIFHRFADHITDMGYTETECPRYPDANIDKRLKSDYVSVCLEKK